MIKIKLASLMVDDQEKALRFYTEIVGFLKKTEIPMGEFRWLTVVSQDAPDGVELVLEPNALPAARTFQKALFDEGIPATAFGVDDLQAEYARMKSLGVVFRGEPSKPGPGPSIVAFEDTCGNLIQLFQL